MTNVKEMLTLLDSISPRIEYIYIVFIQYNHSDKLLWQSNIIHVVSIEYLFHIELSKLTLVNTP